MCCGEVYAGEGDEGGGSRRCRKGGSQCCAAKFRGELGGRTRSAKTRVMHTWQCRELHEQGEHPNLVL